MCHTLPLARVWFGCSHPKSDFGPFPLGCLVDNGTCATSKVKRRQHAIPSSRCFRSPPDLQDNKFTQWDLGLRRLSLSWGLLRPSVCPKRSGVRRNHIHPSMMLAASPMLSMLECARACNIVEIFGCTLAKPQEQLVWMSTRIQHIH
jgi:hypothetical protein